MSNKLVNNTPPLSLNLPPPKKRGGKILNKCRGKDDPGYISVWIFDFVLFISVILDTSCSKPGTTKTTATPPKGFKTVRKCLTL